MGGFATIPAQILAHQGGWDEALFVLGPLIIIGLLLLLANRRADAVGRRTEAAESANPSEIAPAAGTAPGDDTADDA